jgi:hypothetical protein
MYDSRRREVEARLQQAVDQGLRAAAQVALNAVKEEYNPPHYFTGWGHAHGTLTGTLLNSPTMTEPYDLEGDRAISVGTNYKVAAYWELGFHQRLWVWFDEKLGRWFSREGPTRYVRHEVWRPAMEKSAGRQREAFQRQFDRAMG